MSCGGNDLSVKAGALSGVPRRGRRGYSARRAGRAEGDGARRAIPPLSRSFCGNQGRVEKDVTRARDSKSLICRDS